MEANIDQYALMNAKTSVGMYALQGYHDTPQFPLHQTEDYIKMKKCKVKIFIDSDVSKEEKTLFFEIIALHNFHKTLP